MRILHLSTFDQVGGAARATFRLDSALRSIGVDSSMLVRTKTSDCEYVHTCTSSEQLTAPFWYRVQARCIDERRSSLTNTLFTAGYPARSLARERVVGEADVLHAHWVWNFQNPVSLARLMRLGKPIVWTFHDMRALSGGCHFPAGCDGFTKDCAACPQLLPDSAELPRRNLADQVELWTGQSVTVVALSEWMASQVRRSRIFRNSRIEVIPNSLETEEYVPKPRLEARRSLGIPEQAFCIMFGAESGLEKRKGAEVLANALDIFAKEMSRDDSVMFVSFGQPSPVFARFGSRYLSLGTLKGSDVLSAAYSAADVFAVPSLEDTLPNTMLESLACGTPVIGFEGTGGMQETLVETGAGWAVSRGSESALAEQLLTLYRQKDLLHAAAKAGRQRALSRHTPREQAERHLELYTSLESPERKPLPRTFGMVGRSMARAVPKLAIEVLGRNSETRNVI